MKYTKKSIDLIVFLSLCYLLLFSACESGLQKELQKSSKADLSRIVASQVKETPFKEESIEENVFIDVKQMPYNGELLKSASWKDKNGLNTLIISHKSAEKQPDDYQADEKRRAEIFAYNYVTKEEEVTKFWQINDLVYNCWCDCEVTFLEKTLEIKDIDNNGVAENMFMYVLNDRCDASPVASKLMLHSGTEKHVIRGATQTFLGPNKEDIKKMIKEERVEYISFLKNIDQSFETINPKIKAFASKYWDDYVAQENQVFSEE